MINEKLHELVGAAVRQKRRRMRITLQELADSVGLTKPTIYRIENGQGGRFASYMLVCLELGVRLDPIVRMLKETDEWQKWME